MVHKKIKTAFAGIDATGFGHGQSSYYYTRRAKLRRKFVKMSAISDMKSQIIYCIKILHHQRHDSVDFESLLRKANQITPVRTIVADKGYDSEKNHVVSDSLGIVSIIPPRYEDVPIYKTR
ncbi:transposase IS4 family protein, partial [Marine Group I thaumarchaeote SCGC RSA3]